jgi:outer membrane protein TolC
MKLQTTFIVFTLCGLTLKAFGAEATSIRFEDLPRLVAERNENVKASAFAVKAQSERTGFLARSFLPRLSAVAGQEEFKSGSAPADQQGYWRVEGSLNLYRGGRDKLEDQIRFGQRDLAGLTHSSEIQQELREAKRAFWKVLASTKLMQERKEAIEKNEANIKSARRRAGAGIATTADAAQFELNKIALEADLKKLDLEHHRVLNLLSVALAMDEHETIEIVGDFPSVEGTTSVKGLEPAKQLEIRNYQELQRVDELRATRLSRWYLPKLDLYAGYGLPSLTDEYARALRREQELTAGIRITLDLGQSIEDRKEAGARSAEANSAQMRGTHKLREVIANDHDLRHDLSIMSELIKASEAAVTQAQKFLRLTEGEYSRGAKNGPDLLEATRTYFEFRERRIDYLRDYFDTKAQLESLTAGAEPL